MSENQNKNTEGNIYTLYDESGAESLFEHLDTVKFGNGEYCIFVPYNDDENEDEGVLDVVVLEVVKDENEEDALAPLEDEEVLNSVYEIFKERNADLFDFDD